MEHAVHEDDTWHLIEIVFIKWENSGQATKEHPFLAQNGPFDMGSYSLHDLNSVLRICHTACVPSASQRDF